MYLSYFGLAEAPFSIAPDPRYLYLTRSHQEALAHLLYGVNGDGGFVLLTGEIGAGKTTVSRCLLEQMPESCDVAYIFNPKLTVEELLTSICDELGIAFPAGNTSVKVFVDRINAYLLDANARGRHTVLVIDEAQNLSPDVLEQMRLLTNLETNQRKLLQIILLGQPELGEMLARPELRQLAQRIVARYHLGKLSKTEVAPYVRHRLEVSGTQRQLFPESLMGRLYRLSNGVPRVINVLCDRALLGAYAQGKERVDRATLAQAAREVLGAPKPGGRNRLHALTALLIVVAGGALALSAYRWAERDPRTAAASTVTGASAPAPPPASPIPAVTQTAAPLTVTTLELPSGVAHARSRALAYEALFHAWGLELQGGDACRHAESAGLRCRTARGGLDELREMNRPAVLYMRDALGKEFFAMLARLEGERAHVVVGGEPKAVALGTLAGQWSGHYTVLWRPPPQAYETIRFGERGAAVAWLAKHLPREPGEPTARSEDVQVFDDALARRVKRFQLAQGLVPDGVVGAQTVMRLSSLSDQSAPTLSRPTGTP